MSDDDQDTNGNDDTPLNNDYRGDGDAEFRNKPEPTIDEPPLVVSNDDEANNLIKREEAGAIKNEGMSNGGVSDGGVSVVDYEGNEDDSVDQHEDNNEEIILSADV